jgi:hypothetical protein
LLAGGIASKKHLEHARRRAFMPLLQRNSTDRSQPPGGAALPRALGEGGRSMRAGLGLGGLMLMPYSTITKRMPAIDQRQAPGGRGGLSGALGCWLLLLHMRPLSRPQPTSNMCVVMCAFWNTKSDAAKLLVSRVSSGFPNLKPASNTWRRCGSALAV